MSSSKKDKNKYDDDKKKSKDSEKKKSSSSDHHEADVVQDADQFSGISQESDELIFIKDSCNICVHTTDTQAAVSLQVGLQLAIALVIRISILDSDSDKGQNVVQDLLQYIDTEQSNKQKIVIENSKDINVTTTDTDVAVHIQALLQVLLTLVAKLDIL
jgi:spore coat protein X